MIEFKRSGATVYADINTGLSLERPVLRFSWVCSTEMEAELLLLRLRKRLTDKVQEVRKDSYLKGYKHAKAKVAKEDWFSGYME